MPLFDIYDEAFSPRGDTPRGASVSRTGISPSLRHATTLQRVSNRDFPRIAARLGGMSAEDCGERRRETN